MSCDHIVIVGLSENVSNPNLHDVCVNSPAQLRGWTEARQKGVAYGVSVQMIVKHVSLVNNGVGTAHNAVCKLQGKSSEKTII